jgi:hypothetical protein
MRSCIHYDVNRLDVGRGLAASDSSNELSERA